MTNWKSPSEFQAYLCTTSSQPICLWFLSPLLYTKLCSSHSIGFHKKKNAICVGHVKKPAYYDCLDSGVIFKNFLLDCQKNNNNAIQTYDSKGK